MGEARRRGSLEARIAQSIERKKREAAASHERYLRDEAERRAELAKLPTEERRLALFGKARPTTVRTIYGGDRPLLEFRPEAKPKS